MTKVKNPSFIKYASPARKSESKLTTLALGEEGGGKGKTPPKATTAAIGEEGGTKPGNVTTKAIGEEGGTKPGGATTLALGEEGGSSTTGGDTFTTMAVGEEGGGRDGTGGTMTTMALGEEGGSGGNMTTKAIGEEGGTMTTLALGEEGGTWPGSQLPKVSVSGKGVDATVKQHKNAVGIDIKSTPIAFKLAAGAKPPQGSLTAVVNGKSVTVKFTLGSPAGAIAEKLKQKLEAAFGHRFAVDVKMPAGKASRFEAEVLIRNSPMIR